MAHISELVFVDSSVGDRETLLSNLRPEVAAIVLDEHRPAAPRIGRVSRSPTDESTKTSLIWAMVGSCRLKGRSDEA